MTFKEHEGLVGFIIMLAIASLVFGGFIASRAITAHAGSTNANVVANVVVSSVCYLGATPNTITFGTIAPGASIPANVAVTVNDVDGNIDGYLSVEGGNWISTAPAASFEVSNTTWSATEDEPFASANALSTTPANTGIIVPFSTASNTIYFGLAIPGATTAATYTQNIILSNSCG